MELYLLRHGIAVDRGERGFEDDDARPLTAKGRRQLRKNAAVIEELAGPLTSFSRARCCAPNRQRKLWPGN